MYRLVVFKKNKGCPNCAILDRLAPTIQAKYPDVGWDYVVFDPDNPTELPEYVKSFPTAVLYRYEDMQHGSELFVHSGYDGLAKKIHMSVNSDENK